MIVEWFWLNRCRLRDNCASVSLCLPRGRGGKRLWKSSREGGLNFKKSSAGVISTDNSSASNVFKIR